MLAVAAPVLVTKTAEGLSVNTSGKVSLLPAFISTSCIFTVARSVSKQKLSHSQSSPSSASRYL